LKTQKWTIDVEGIIGLTDSTYKEVKGWIREAQREGSVKSNDNFDLAELVEIIKLTKHNQLASKLSRSLNRRKRLERFQDEIEEILADNKTAI